MGSNPASPALYSASCVTSNKILFSCNFKDKNKYSLPLYLDMAMNLIGKILAVITILWGVFFLIVYWTTYLEMELFDDDEIIYMACVNTIAFSAITIGFLVFRLQMNEPVIIQSN